MEVFSLSSVGVWVKAARAPFLVASAIPAMLGGLVAFAVLPRGSEQFSWLVFVVAIIANMTANISANLSNDYYDHLSTDDDINVDITPFSGGSRTIQNNVMPAKSVLNGALVTLAITFVTGMYLVLTRTIWLLPIGLVGLFIAFFYTAPPIKFVYRGLGELVIGLVFGPLSVGGAYISQTGTLEGLAWLWPCIPVGLLVLGILFINEFPDYNADKAVGKNHLVVLLGRKNALLAYYVLLAVIFLSIPGFVVAGLMPPITLIGLLGVPLAVKAASVASKNYENPQGMIPAQGSHILAFVVTGLMLSVGYLVQGLFLR